MKSLENSIGNIGKWKYWKMELPETLKVEMELETLKLKKLENGIENIGKLNQNHWKEKHWKV